MKTLKEILESDLNDSEKIKLVRNLSTKCRRLTNYNPDDEYITKIWSKADVIQEFENQELSFTDGDINTVFNTVCDSLSDCFDSEWFILQEAVLDYNNFTLKNSNEQ